MGSGGHPLTMGDGGTPPSELEQLVQRVPEGTRVSCGGRSDGLSRTTHTGGRSVSVCAEELGGSAALDPCTTSSSTVPRGGVGHK